jgi:hypothetical protein
MIRAYLALLGMVAAAFLVPQQAWAQLSTDGLKARAELISDHESAAP